MQVWATHHGPTGNGFNHLVAQNESFYLGTDAGNIIRASDHWGDTNVEYPLDIWTNIALVKSSVDLKMYIDGDLVAVQSGEIPLQTKNFLLENNLETLLSIGLEIFTELVSLTLLSTKVK